MNSVSKSSIVLILLASLIGCTQPDKGESSGADFYVTDVSAERIQPQVVKDNSQWIKTVSVKYTLKACIKDRATQDQAKGHRFQVRTPEGVLFDALDPNDTNGCFRWIEEFPYDEYASQTFYIPVRRDVVGSGIYNGSRTIEFAINPWTVGDRARDKSDPFVLLNDGTRQRDRIEDGKIVPIGAANKALMGEPMTPEVLGMDGVAVREAADQAARIWVKDISFKTIRRRTMGDGVILDALLSMKPILKLRDTDGNIQTKNLNSGEFDITAHLVVTDTGKEENMKMIITDPRGMSGIGVVDLDTLTTQLRAKWNRRAHTGNVTLALMVTPRGKNSKIARFEGLFELGGLSSLEGGSSAENLPTCTHPSELGSLPTSSAGLNTSNRPCQDVTKFLAGTKTLVKKDGKEVLVENYEILKGDGYASPNDPLIFDDLKLRFMSVLPGETATQRNIGYSVSTCVTDRFSGSKMANIPFIIEYLDKDGNVIPEQSQKKRTNDVGCLKWNATVHHAYYGPEEFIWHSVRLRTEKSENNFMKVKRYALNPWDDKFTFGWDEEEFAPDFLKSKKAKSRFFMASFGYHTVRFLYNIDPYMELEVKKTVLLDLEPRVLRYAGIVNARKQTEPLRDGIYLMKVGIQKDFLDPTDRAVDLGTGERKSQAAGGSQVPSVILKSLGPVTPREYITTDTSLVRVVDGHLIHPIELTMRDLRLMRVRSNFLIQFETVDERKIQAHDVFNKLMKDDLGKLKAGLEDLKERRKKAELKRSGSAQSKEFANEAEELAFDQKKEEQLLSQSRAIRARYKAAFASMKEQLENMPFVNNNFQLDDELLKPVKDVLQVNDFTDVKLPNKDEVAGEGLNTFIEDAGLERRTFVGPVIFLSNAYSDSVRATDNLDEACNEDVIKVGQKRYIEGSSEEEEADSDRLETERSLLEENEGVDGVASLKDTRQNKAYRYSRYYGALTHLCNAHVDDLIKREKVAEKRYREIMPLASSKANMARVHGLDYLSLVDEPLETLPEDACEKDPFCKNLRTRTISKDHAIKLLNYDMPWRMTVADSTYVPTLIQKPSAQVTAANLHDIMLPPMDFQKIGSGGDGKAYKKKVEGTSDVVASCSLLSDLAYERLMILDRDPRGKEALGKMAGRTDKVRQDTVASMFASCVREQTTGGRALVVDDKFKVFQTGSDYVFRGGLQMNFNVGDAVSFSDSDSWSGSFKFDDIPSGLRTALIGGGALLAIATGIVPGTLIGGATAALILGGGYDLATGLTKPLGLSRSTSLSSSTGTSVSKGTYLVSQMAKFDVPLESFQRCRIVRFDAEFAEAMRERFSLARGVEQVIGKGLMTCSETVSGLKGAQALRVPETYFYFTQHFTEGDMLDQADLYNHPWLLGMRGVRDFGSFVQAINAQEVPSLTGFWNGLGAASETPPGWPLDHLASTYRQQVPTFPGFYSLSTYEEAITTYPLNLDWSQAETDINAEVACSMEKSTQGRPTCAEKLAGVKKN